jgi:hypothetical protein
LDVDTFALLFMDLQVVFPWVNQIFDLFVIDFAHRSFDTEFNVFTGSLDPVEHSSYHSRNDTLVLYVIKLWAHHRVSLSRGCLTIRENGSIETIKDRVNDGSRRLVINILLLAIGIKDSIKLKLVLRCSSVHIDGDLLAVLVEVKAAFAPLSYFFGIKRPHSADHLNISRR